MRDMHIEKWNKAPGKILVFVLLICIAMFSFSSPLVADSHTDYCHMSNHASNHSTMHNMCFNCDCGKKTNVLLRLNGMVGRDISFLLDSLFLIMAFLCASASIYGLHTPIVLKTRMNN